MDLRIYPPEEIIDTEVSLPLSKSIANRLMIIDAIACGGQDGFASLAAISDDTRAMAAALRERSGLVDVGPAGTAMRFLTAYFAALPGADVTLDGTERMRRRPIGPLVDALRALGADIEYKGEDGFPPLSIKGRALHGGELEIDATISSQFLSAILMAAPGFDTPLFLRFRGAPASESYLKMTVALMRSRGIDVDMTPQGITVAPGKYTPAPATHDIEPDWSAAAFWYEIAAISAGWVRLPGLRSPSIQGDSVCASLFDRLGVVTEFEDGGAQLSASPETWSRVEADMSDCPDLVLPLAVTCCLLSVPFRFTGVESLHIKECDRVEALVAELRRLTYVLYTEGSGVIGWEGRRAPVGETAEIATYADHRMAMAFAPAALFYPGIVIRDAEVVSKSYPRFWDDLCAAGFMVLDAAEPVPVFEEENQQ